MCAAVAVDLVDIQQFDEIFFSFWKPYLVSNAFTLSSLSCESRGNQIGLSFKTLFDVCLVASEYESSHYLKGSISK